MKWKNVGALKVMATNSCQFQRYKLSFLWSSIPIFYIYIYIIKQIKKITRNIKYFDAISMHSSKVYVLTFTITFSFTTWIPSYRLPDMFFESFAIFVDFKTLATVYQQKGLAVVVVLPHNTAVYYKHSVNLYYTVKGKHGTAKASMVAHIEICSFMTWIIWKQKTVRVYLTRRWFSQHTYESYS